MTATVTTCRARYNEYGRALDKDYFRALGDSGIKIYYVMCNNLGLDDKAINILKFNIKKGETKMFYLK